MSATVYHSAEASSICVDTAIKSEESSIPSSPTVSAFEPVSPSKSSSTASPVPPSIFQFASGSPFVNTALFPSLLVAHSPESLPSPLLSSPPPPPPQAVATVDKVTSHLSLLLQQLAYNNLILQARAVQPALQSFLSPPSAAPRRSSYTFSSAETLAMSDAQGIPTATPVRRKSTPSTSAKEVRCPVCDKAFTRPWLLQNHLRVHTGEKPYKCTTCGKAFADKSNLRAHIQTHSGIKPYSCLRCGKSFALKAYLSKHEESACLKGSRQQRNEWKPPVLPSLVPFPTRVC